MKMEGFLKTPDTTPGVTEPFHCISNFKIRALIKHKLQMNIFEVFKVVISATSERKLLSRCLC